MSNPYILEMKHIDKSFPGVQALKDVQLNVRPGTVHSLMGENGAGKSTLMKCLFGLYKEDSGEVYLDGEKVRFANPKQALENGVSMVHQELNQVLRRSVMENMWLGRFPKTAGLISHNKMYKDTAMLFKNLEMDIDPLVEIGKLSVSERQMVEIAKAVSYDAKVLVLDEPTSSLTEEEVAQLFRIIRRLCSDKVGIIYISHKMEEILEISDDVTILRDGEWITTESASELTTDKIIKLMVGRDLTHRFPPKINVVSDEVLMKVENLTGKYVPMCKDVSFELKKGEILGIAGLVGSRRTELLETIFGVRTKESGTVSLHDEEIKNADSKKAIKNGFAFITEERRATGLFPLRNVTFNSAIANIANYKRFGLLSNSMMEKDTSWIIDVMHVKTPSSKTLIKSLSGGNQQKIIIGRWLLTQPEVLLMDEPTRGIDVGAKYEIYQLILDLAKEDKGIVMVSSEMPELIGICDRILVMSNGRMAGILDMSEDHEGKEQEEIMRLAAKYI